MPSASAQETVTITNTHPTLEQSIVDAEGRVGEKWKRYEIAPGMVDTVPSALAQLFLADRSFVSKYVAPEIPVLHGEPKIWVANGTGNPWLPKMIKVRRVRREEWEDHEIPNTLRTPVKLRYTMSGDQTKVLTDDGTSHETRWGPKKVFEIPPMARLPISRTYATWMQSRDHNAEEHKKGKLRLISEPKGYEPAPDWDLDRLQRYGELFWGRDFWRKDEEIFKVFDSKPGDFPDAYDRVRATQLLYRALHFLILDDTVTLPESKREFEDYLRQRAKAKPAA